MTDTLVAPLAPQISEAAADILLDEIDVAMAEIQASHINGAYVKADKCMDIFLDFRQAVAHLRDGVESVPSN